MGDAENARHENAAPECKGGKCETWICGTRLQGWKMRDMKMRHQNARLENARHEFSAPDCRGGKCEIWKCEKRESMEHRMLYMSIHCIYTSCAVSCAFNCVALIIYSLFHFIPRIFAILKSKTTCRTLCLHLKIDFDTDLMPNITRHSCIISAELVVCSFINTTTTTTV